jgi:Glu-tRNA(Gln) amidotransferase subunit E-like FAD-binding protein
MFRVEPEETLTVPILRELTKFNLFQENPILLVAIFRVQSSVIPSILEEFVSELMEKGVNITDINFTGLERLHEAFGSPNLERSLRVAIIHELCTEQKMRRSSANGSA